MISAINLTEGLAHVLSSTRFFMEEVSHTCINAREKEFLALEQKELRPYTKGSNVKFLCKTPMIANFKNDPKNASYYVVDYKMFNKHYIINYYNLPETAKEYILNKYQKPNSLLITPEQLNYLNTPIAIDLKPKYVCKAPLDKPTVHLGEVVVKNQSKILSVEEYNRLKSYIDNDENKDLAYAIINNCSYSDNIHYLLTLLSGLSEHQRYQYAKQYPNFGIAMSYYVEDWADDFEINLDTMIPIVLAFFPTNNREKIDFIISNYRYVKRK
jgi:hypothetical protein